jgi:hypothetical protein
LIIAALVVLIARIQRGLGGGARAGVEGSDVSVRRMIRSQASGDRVESTTAPAAASPVSGLKTGY